MIDIRIEGLVHVYPSGVRAVDGVDLRITGGERVAIIGQNGSGKTTLVRHFNGLLRPTEGAVMVGEHDARSRTVAQLAGQVGLVFQDPDRQIFRSSVRSEIEFGPRNLGLRGAQLDRAVQGALALTELAGDADANPGDLGSSRRKLLALASVIAMGTPVVVLDEPTTGQDFRGTSIVERVIASIHDAGRTVITISHDMRFVAEQFERVVVMRLGRVILDGPPDRVFAPTSWDELRSTFVEPPLPAILGDRLGLASTPSADAFVDAYLGRT